MIISRTIFRSYFAFEMMNILSQKQAIQELLQLPDQRKLLKDLFSFIFRTTKLGLRLYYPLATI